MHKILKSVFCEHYDGFTFPIKKLTNKYFILPNIYETYSNSTKDQWEGEEIKKRKTISDTEAINILRKTNKTFLFNEQKEMDLIQDKTQKMLRENSEDENSKNDKNWDLIQDKTQKISQENCEDETSNSALKKEKCKRNDFISRGNSGDDDLNNNRKKVVIKQKERFYERQFESLANRYEQTNRSYEKQIDDIKKRNEKEFQDLKKHYDFLTKVYENIIEDLKNSIKDIKKSSEKQIGELKEDHDQQKKVVKEKIVEFLNGGEKKEDFQSFLLTIMLLL